MGFVKKRILDRYEHTVSGSVIIDVAAQRVEDLYENFDKTAPYHKKDLDEDLVYYLTECVTEIGRVDFVIRFMFECFPSEEFMLRVRTSVHKYFMYLRELEFAQAGGYDTTSNLHGRSKFCQHQDGQCSHRQLFSIQPEQSSL